jgi:hypothetical protein
LVEHRYAIATVLLLGVVATISYHEGSRLRRDFHHFYLDARYVWEHGQLNPDLDNPDKLQRRQLPFYLPVVSLLLAPVTFGGVPVAAALWALGQTLCVAGVLRALWGWCRSHQGLRSPALVLAASCLLGAPAIYEAVKFNQLTFPVLALLLGVFKTLERGQPRRAGALLGLATVMKLLPVLLLLWLALKRQWTALAAAVVAVALVTIVPCLAVFGPQKTLQYHREWWEHNLHGPPVRDMADDEQTNHFIDRRNQALPVVFGRLFCADHPYHVSFQPVKLAASTCVWAAQAVLAGLGAALIWQTRRPWRNLQSPQRQTEVGAYLLAMMVFSPLLRQYYLVWALPAVLLFVRLAAETAARKRRIGQLGMAVWLLGLLLWMWEPARACGAHWLMLVAMGALLLCQDSRPHGADGTWGAGADRA